MYKDIEFLDEIINLKDREKLLERKFFWIYPFTNENIKGYFSKIDFKNKDILSVTSSGDHILNAISYGAKEVTAFDINPLAKHFVELKIAAIKTLSLEEFIMFFYDKKLTKYKYFLNKDTYMKIRENLKDDNRIFWDHFFNTYTKKDVFKSYLISDDYLNLKGILEVNNYLKENNYYKLREQLKYTNIHYHDISFKELKKLNKRFDVILLSNVPAFLEYMYNKDILRNFKDVLNSIKKDNTKIAINYYYDNILYDDNKLMQDYKELSELFNEEEYEYKIIESTHNIQTGFFGIKNDREDIVLMSK